ncbi:hypothetical protein [Sphingosinicella sp. BN140058]|uniref:hypothetical protein n=1 Tax=Sphingosinicella sp. BN140058 TaxID=1892855 RepID=UPI0010136E0C|nr:hypothetical protein [Sphingosinicella sp. BN140058]QAY75412.1 hypothetical protein ETR14_01870 [Sphingosinicella sp. BN140058]
MMLFRIAAAGALALLAAACLLTPGRFDAALDVRRDGSFSYRYAGEMIFVSPGSAAAAAAAEEEPFKPEDQICTGAGGDDASDAAGDEARECTAEELAEKRKEYEDGRAERLAKKKQEGEIAKQMFGGMDPSDPKTMEEFARRLQGNAGWKSVRHKGNGVFDVQYELSGRLDHDFVFPVFPEVDMVIPFVKVGRLTGNRVKIVAPAFVQSADGGLKALGAAMQGQSGAAEAGLKKPEGTFTLTTDGEILTNNTREGPSRQGTGRTLEWTIGPLDTNRPEALLQL